MQVGVKDNFLVLLFFMLSSSLFSISHATSCGTSGTLDTTDVTFNNAAASSCGGSYSGNNSNVNINTVNSGELKFSGTDWGNEIKDDSPGSPGSGTGSFLGIDWTLSADAGKSGSWTLSIFDPAPTSLPVSVDLLAVLKGSNNWAGYLFSNQTFVTEGTTNGSFQIKFTNIGNKIPNLSHMSLYLRPSAVSVPVAVWLFGTAIVGLVSFRRKKIIL